METKPADADASFNAYLGRFAIVYVLAIAAVGAIAYVLETVFAISVPGAAATIATSGAAALAAVNAFVRDTGRAPARGERAVFALLATLLSLAISIAAIVLISGVVLGFDMILPAARGLLNIGELGPGLLAFAFLFAAVMSWLVVYFFCGIFAKQALKKRQ